MNRRDFILVGSASFSAAASGCLGSTEPEDQGDEWVGVAVRPDDLIVGSDDKQVLLIEVIVSNVQGKRLPNENQDHHVKIDTSPLERYGGDVENLSVEMADQESLPSNTTTPNIDTLDITDGVIDLVVSQLEDIREYFLGLQLTGFQFTDVGPITDVKYDIQSSDDYVEVVNVNSDGSADGNGEFRLINPQVLPPTLSPERLTLGGQDQSQLLSIEWLTPDDDEVLIEIDMSTLEEYGTIRGPVVEKEVRGAVSEEATIDDWTVSMRLVPDSDTNYVWVDIAINGIEITTAGPVENLAYEMTVEGDAHETVETEPFDIFWEEEGEH